MFHFLFQAVLRNKTGILTFFLSLSQEGSGPGNDHKFSSSHTTVSDFKNWYYILKNAVLMHYNWKVI